ncbi:sensor histidine kinase [Paraburkholderia tropica]|uniref:sensor histidine kinase n=1 Tax=Paraburkholderia tropica TaxID=92647 RepID=UPI002AB26E5C|nr:HAMP domain-containing sensor histidine kinase [Paraburkholderia tropica]
MQTKTRDTGWAPPAFSNRWRSSASRFIFAYAVFFSVAVTVLLGAIGVQATGMMQRATDIIIDWQLNYFTSFDGPALREAISARLETDRDHKNHYGLYDLDGMRLAGDVVALPAEIQVVPQDAASSEREGTTVEDALALTSGRVVATARVMVEQRSGGLRLLVARDVEHMDALRSRAVKALVLGGAIWLSAGIFVALLLNRRQASRIAEVQAATLEISRGELARRLPIRGADEIDMLSHLVNHMLGEVERLLGEVKGASDGIAHDLRAPLARMRTDISRIATRVAEYGDADLDGELARVGANASLLLERFRALMRISEIGALKRRGAFEVVSVASLVRDVGDLYEPLADSCGLALEVTTGSDMSLMCDRALLFEALSNLVDNAIKFSPAGGMVKVQLSNASLGAVIEVTDSGPGVPPEEREAVFQRFYRCEATRDKPGSGLGLSIVAAIVALHEFGLSVEDALPGARFRIECWPHADRVSR